MPVEFSNGNLNFRLVCVCLSRQELLKTNCISYRQEICREMSPIILLFFSLNFLHSYAHGENTHDDFDVTQFENDYG